MEEAEEREEEEDGGGRGVRAGPGAAARALPPREGYVCPKTQAESPTRH